MNNIIVLCKHSGAPSQRKDNSSISHLRLVHFIKLDLKKERKSISSYRMKMHNLITVIEGLQSRDMLCMLNASSATGSPMAGAVKDLT